MSITLCNSKIFSSKYRCWMNVASFDSTLAKEDSYIDQVTIGNLYMSLYCKTGKWKRKEFIHSTKKVLYFLSKMNSFLIPSFLPVLWYSFHKTSYTYSGYIKAYLLCLFHTETRKKGPCKVKRKIDTKHCQLINGLTKHTRIPTLKYGNT